MIFHVFYAELFGPKQLIRFQRVNHRPPAVITRRKIIVYQKKA